MKRNQARLDRDFALSDKIRDELLSNKIVLEDSKNGTIWRKL
jgi:cysteinyl-tRNA synthetase